MNQKIFKLRVVGSIPIARSNFFKHLQPPQSVPGATRPRSVRVNRSLPVRTAGLLWPEPHSFDSFSYAGAAPGDDPKRLEITGTPREVKSA